MNTPLHPSNRRPFLAAVGFCCFAAAAAVGQTTDAPSPWAGPDYGQAFSDRWYDGHAELASYDLTYPRYGQLRSGTAVAITVTEPFDREAYVKADTAGDASFNVVKLNLVEDFQTGIYDYNLMLSVFVGVEPAHELPAGATQKLSFSAQEWCGHAYQQTLFSGEADAPGFEQTSHSYFQGEADQHVVGDRPADGFTEDALILWARGLAGPTIEPGQSIDVPLYRSLAVQRLRHQPWAWDRATLRRQAEVTSAAVPAGSFDEVEVLQAEVRSDAGDRTYTFYVDAAEGGNRRLLKLERSDGYQMELRGSERLPYWQLHDEGDETSLEGLDLERRSPGQM